MWLKKEIESVHENVSPSTLLTPVIRCLHTHEKNYFQRRKCTGYSYTQIHLHQCVTAQWLRNTGIEKCNNLTLMASHAYQQKLTTIISHVASRRSIARDSEIERGWGSPTLVYIYKHRYAYTYLYLFRHFRCRQRARV